MKRLSRTLIVVLTVLLMAGSVAAMFIDVQFIGGADIAGYETWAWGEGTAAPNAEVERAARATIEQQMTTKGYNRVEGKADCYIAIHVKKDEWFDGGLFRIDVVDGASQKVAWRGKAEGTIGTQSTGKRQTLAQRAVKKMFKKFPARRVAD